MPVALDYNSAINYQYDNLERSKKSFDRHFAAKWLTTKFIPRLINRLNSLLISQLLSAKGALGEVTKNIDKIEGKDLTENINKLNNLLNLTVSFQSEIDNLIKNNEHHTYPNLVITQSTLDEIIDHLYSIVRVYQKATLITPIETTELAKGLSRRSVNSLEKVAYGR